MSLPKHIAVIDVGKTNAKLALVDGESLEELAVVTRPNRVLAAPPYPHFDLEAHWAFFLDQLTAFHRDHGIDAISITTHGAAGVLLDKDGDLATPMLDYEYSGPDDVADAYNAIRPPFSETGSPRLPLGLNLGAQLFWLFDTIPDLKERTAHIVTYPQYWGFRLTGCVASDVSSLGCHTDLWAPQTGTPSSLVDRLSIADKLAPAHHASDVLGTLLPEISARTGLRPDIPVLCGLHDSNASLLPHLLGRKGSFNVVSTGTWVIAMAINGRKTTLDQTRDTLINVSAYGDPVPSARFMGGREYEVIRDGVDAEPTDADRVSVLARNIMLLPAVATESGPFAGRAHRWTALPRTDGERMYALALYLALMTDTCLSLIGGQGPTIVEGPFARNADFIDMLSELRNGAGIEIARSATGTSIGAALLFATTGIKSETATITRASDPALAAYARRWHAQVDG